MSDYKKQLDELQEKYNNKKLERAKLEERLKTVEEEQLKDKASLEELGLDEKDLKEEIKTLKEELESGIKKCQSQLT